MLIYVGLLGHMILLTQNNFTKEKKIRKKLFKYMVLPVPRAQERYYSQTQQIVVYNPSFFD